MDQARRTAVERMTAQCAELGGDGVVGLRVSRGSFLLGGQEFMALGTAVRARGAEDGPARADFAPFTSDLSGQDFAKLIMAGWVPVGLVLGVAIGASHTTGRPRARPAGGRVIARSPVGLDVLSKFEHDATPGTGWKPHVERLGAEGAVDREHAAAGECAGLPGAGRPPRSHHRGQRPRHRRRSVRPSQTKRPRA